MKRPYLSIVMPAYNEVQNFKAGVLKPSFAYLREQKYTWEVLFVDDGSTDETYQFLKAFCKRIKHCRLLQIPHGGRAAAMTKGMLEARGKYILYTDFDQSTSLDQVLPFLTTLESGGDLAIGSRGHGRTTRYDSLLNMLRAGAFARLSRTFFLPGIVDTSCGFKLYKNEVAKLIFSSLKVSIPKQLKDAYMGAVDTEILFLARKFKLKIAQIPVDWIKRPGTRLHLIKETTRIVRDLGLIKYYSFIGAYDQQSVYTDYDAWWRNYSGVNHFDPGTRIRREIIAEELRNHNFSTLLDLGCGSGKLLEYFKDRFPQVKLSGADISQTALKLLASKHITQQLYQIDLEKPIPMRTKFDVVICSEVIEHLKKWQTSLENMAEVTKGGGVAILTTQSGKIYPHNKLMGHLQHFDPETLIEEARKKGFKVVNTYSFGWPFMNLKNEIVSRVVLRRGRLSPLQSWTDIVIFNIFYFLFRISSRYHGPQVILKLVKKSNVS